MTILFINKTQIRLKSTYIAEIVANPGNYTKIDISGNINCCTQNCGQQVTTLTINLPQIIDTDKAEFSDDDILIYPKFFGLTEFIDGIYTFDFKRYQEDAGTVLESNCAFADVTYKCKVATLLKDIIEENKKNTQEKISTIAHLLHYSLFNGSNCGCNCAEMCINFRELTKLLANIDPQITNDCGC